MPRLTVLLSCALLLIAVSPLRAGTAEAPAKRMAMKPEDLYEKFSGAVVSIDIQVAGKKASGTGFLWGAGEVVTNFHVIAGAQSISVEMVDGRKIPAAGIIWADRERDLAVFSLSGRHSDAQFRPTHPVVRVPPIQGAPKIGSTVYVIGDPVGLKRTISNGLVGGVRAYNSLHTVYQITAPISPGNSGSPVFNEYGEVIGVVTSMLTNAQNVNFCVPSSYITPATHFEMMPLTEWAEFSKEGTGGGGARKTVEAPVPERVKALMEKKEYSALALRGVKSASVFTVELSETISDVVVRNELTDLAVGRLRGGIAGFRVLDSREKPEDPQGEEEVPDCIVTLELVPLNIQGGKAVIVSVTVYRWVTPVVAEDKGNLVPIDAGGSPAPIWHRMTLLTGGISDLDARIKEELRKMLDRFGKDVTQSRTPADEK